jgi:hypothetical protein
MGIVHVHRGRLAPALILLALLALLAFSALLATEQASAKPRFTDCATCHNYSGGDAFHAKATHSSAGCATCHVDGFGAANAGVLPSACVSCHGGTTAILAGTTHAANACGTTPGCHGVPPASTTMTAKVAPTVVAVGKSVKVTGTAGPAAWLKGAKVSSKVERKVATKWVKMKTGSTTVKATGAFTWSYKTAKKGAHRVTASIAKSSTYTAKKVVKTFKVR